MLLYFVSVQQMTAEGQSDRMVSDMELYIKPRGETEFLCAEKMALIDIHCLLWNAYGNSGCEHCEAAGGVSAVVTATWGHLHRCRF